MKVEERQKFLLILTLVVVALYVGDLLVFEPLGKLWTSRLHTIKDLRNDVKEGKFLLAREDFIRGQWAEMNTNTLPSNTSLAEQQIFTAFDGWSRDSGATVTGITPQWKNDATNYMTLNCRVEASGDLRTLSRFVYDVEKGPTALKLDSIEFSTHDTVGQELTLGLQLSGLALITQKK